jgi:biopolymer transport protein ExbD
MASNNLGAAGHTGGSETRPDAHPGQSGVTGINVTPLIDVLLVLLLIGLVSFMAARKSLSVEVPLPVSSAGFPTQIVLELPDDGRWLLNGQPIPATQVAAVLGSVLRTRPARVVFIKTGPGRTYQDFIGAVDLARGAGAEIVAVVGGAPY